MPGRYRSSSRVAKKAVSFGDPSPSKNKAVNDINLALLDFTRQNEQIVNNNKVPARWLISGEEFLKKKKLCTSSNSKCSHIWPTDQELAGYMVERFGSKKAQEKLDMKNYDENKPVSHENELAIGEDNDEKVKEVQLDPSQKKSTNQKVGVTKPKVKPSRVSPRKGSTPPLVNSPNKTTRSSGRSPTANYGCKKCERSYSDEQSLRKHMVNIHKVSSTGGRSRMTK